MASIADPRPTNPSAGARGPFGSYWNESRRPLMSLYFVLPLLAAYELGVLIVPTTMRNGADAWMRRLLDMLGFGGYFLLPCLTVGALLAWHHLLRESWRVKRGTLLGMVFESAALAGALIGLAHLQGLLFSASISSVNNSIVVTLGRIVAFCGAGLYEEVLFRLLLVPAAARMLAIVRLPRAWCLFGAVVSTSLLFSLAHYVGAGGDAWDFSSFLFRFLAGAVFAVLFVTRGFGITAGTHAIYDVLVGVA